jgi:UDP-3-O-[3-hydroxymyristoyl] N-acetylglucosamine deacetylase
MITIEGVGLHTGRPVILRLVRTSDDQAPIRIAWETLDVPIADLIIEQEIERSTKLSTRDGKHTIQTVEHLFAALAALSSRSGLRIEIAGGPEIPLVDGCARTFVDALTTLETPTTPPRMEIVTSGRIEIGASTYDFATEGNAISVVIDFNDPRLVPSASWNVGDAAYFKDHIAPARTFAFEHEIATLLGQNLANHIAPESVVVIGEQEVHHAGRPFSWDEPAHHKLLDLIGDLYAHGGPPRRGSIRATRPGHRATHRALALARGRGLITNR